MANPRHSTPQDRPAADVTVDGEHVNDAMGQLRHSARILTLAIVGLVHSPHEIRGHQSGPYTYEIDDDWMHDVESLAFNLVHDLEKILSAMEAGGQS